MKKTPVRHIGPTPTPTNVRAKHSSINGQIFLGANASKRGLTYESRCSLASDPENYIQIVQSSGARRIVFSDLPQGVLVIFQIRAYGPNGWSEWSDVVIIMVL